MRAAISRESRTDPAGAAMRNFHAASSRRSRKRRATGHASAKVVWRGTRLARQILRDPSLLLELAGLKKRGGEQILAIIRIFRFLQTK